MPRLKKLWKGIRKRFKPRNDRNEAAATAHPATNKRAHTPIKQRPPYDEIDSDGLVTWPADRDKPLYQNEANRSPHQGEATNSDIEIPDVRVCGDDEDEEEEENYCMTPILSPRHGVALPSFENNIYTDAAEDLGVAETAHPTRAIQKDESLYTKPKKKSLKPPDKGKMNQLQYVEVEFCQPPSKADLKKRSASPVNYTNVIHNNGAVVIASEQGR